MWWKRFDGELVNGLDAERRIMPYLMRGRNESIALFDADVDVTATESFLAEYARRDPDAEATVFHVVLWGLARTLHRYPRLNRFVAGGRLYQRDGIWISFAAKEEMDESSPLVTVKRRYDPDEGFSSLVRCVHQEVARARRGPGTVDRELDFFLRLPGSGLRAAVALVRLADRFGVLPRFFVEPDPMFASAWVANLGSLHMPPVFHHLYEYGNAGVFVTIGQVAERPVVRDGRVVVGRVLPLRVSYDERIDDGMYAGHAARLLQDLVEDPAAHGCQLPTAVAPAAVAPGTVAPAAGAPPAGRRAS